ncbi:peroxidase family protein [Aeoliella sp.]|uniref:peroxidase family protein n=1 Tax=Aeoliella sp. TaxID=2795800 RepID=UPI003CCB8DB4
MKNYTPAARGRTEQLEQRRMLAADSGGPLSLDPLVEFPLVEVAAVDGTNNNLANPDWGAALTELLRLTAEEYADGAATPTGEDRPSAREVSNSVADQTELESNDRYLTDFVWIWGQFIDHDIDLTVGADPSEDFAIDVPTGDAWFDPTGSGEATIGLSRSNYTVDEDGVRQQINSITAYLDGSVVYGSDTADSLRTFEGGRMLTSEGDLLPIGESGFFMAGDIRANENVALTAMHTIWVREHNRLADAIAEADPALSDEDVYQQARAIVTAEIQAITYNEWLPALLGVDAIESYRGYDSTVNTSIANVFSTAAYRFGHSMLSTELLRLDADGSVADEGNLSLADAFFSPGEITENGIESLLLGASSQLAQEVDTQVVDDVRNFLFGPPGAGGFDLASLNIQRGRDHGLADYNQVREDYGLPRVMSFTEITSDADLAAKLEALYGSVDNVDPWVGILAEDHVAGSSLGELGRTILIDQFTRIRDGDRFWYENRFDGPALDALRTTTLANVIERNTTITDLRTNLFFGEEVLYYAASRESGNLDATVRVADGDLQLVDNRSQAVLASVAVESAAKVIVMGTRGDDRIAVHPTAMNLSLEGGFVIDGRGGRRDMLTLAGGPSFDRVTLDGAFADFSGTTVQVEDIDQLVVAPGEGPDQVQVIDRGDYDLEINDDARRRRDRRDSPPVDEPMPDEQVDTRLTRRDRRRR